MIRRWQLSCRETNDPANDGLLIVPVLPWWWWLIAPNTIHDSPRCFRMHKLGLKRLRAMASTVSATWWVRTFRIRMMDVVNAASTSEWFVSTRMVANNCAGDVLGGELSETALLVRFCRQHHVSLHTNIIRIKFTSLPLLHLSGYTVFQIPRVCLERDVLDKWCLNTHYPPYKVNHFVCSETWASVDIESNTHAVLILNMVSNEWIMIVKQTHWNPTLMVLNWITIC